MSIEADCLTVKGLQTNFTVNILNITFRSHLYTYKQTPHSRTSLR